MAKPGKLLGTAEDTETAFYDAIARADIDALMMLWADDEDIVCIHPGAPRLIGHSAIRASWEAIFERGGVRIRPVQLHVTHNLMSAVHNVIEEVGGTEDGQQDMHIVATNIYMKTPHGWRIAVHHASVAPGSALTEHASVTILH